MCGRLLDLACMLLGGATVCGVTALFARVSIDLWLGSGPRVNRSNRMNE